jgi:hypothetical protein
MAEFRIRPESLPAKEIAVQLSVEGLYRPPSAKYMPFHPHKLSLGVY